MAWFANILWLGGSLPLLAMLVAARPTRGENLTAAHLVTGPAALPPTIAAAIFLWLTRDTLGLPAWLGLLSLPGYWVAMLALPLAATGRRRAWLYKSAGLMGFAGPGLLGNGALLAAWVPWLGYAVLASFAGIVYGLAAPHLWRRVLPHVLPDVLHRFFLARRRRHEEPSSFELSQATWQRERWQLVSASATVDELLAFARAFAPEVKAASLERLAAHPELADSLAKSIVSGRDSDALHYLVHHYPRSRHELAPALSTRLDQLQAIWSKAFCRAAEPPHLPGGLGGLFDASIAVLRDGGDLRAPLERWQTLLASRPDYLGVAKELARHLRRWRPQ